MPKLLVRLKQIKLDDAILPKGMLSLKGRNLRVDRAFFVASEASLSPLILLHHAHGEVILEIEGGMYNADWFEIVGKSYVPNISKFISKQYNNIVGLLAIRQI